MHTTNHQEILNYATVEGERFSFTRKAKNYYLHVGPELRGRLWLQWNTCNSDRSFRRFFMKMS